MIIKIIHKNNNQIINFNCIFEVKIKFMNKDIITFTNNIKECYKNTFSSAFGSRRETSGAELSSFFHNIKYPSSLTDPKNSPFHKLNFNYYI